MDVSSLTRQGVMNFKNGDNYKIIDDKYFVIADGVSGELQGAEASESLVNYISKEVQKKHKKHDYNDLIKNAERNFLFDGVYGETTGIVFEIRNGKIKGSSVGDSEVVLIRGEDMIELTHKQNRKPRIGSFEIIPVSFEMEVQKDDVIIAGTDGLFNFVTRGKIEKIVKEKKFNVVSSSLLSEALWEDRLEDDFTVIAIKV